MIEPCYLRGVIGRDTYESLNHSVRSEFASSATRALQVYSVNKQVQTTIIVIIARRKKNITTGEIPENATRVLGKYELVQALLAGSLDEFSEDASKPIGSDLK